MTGDAAGLLEALKQAHHLLLARLDALALLTDQDDPNRTELSAARYNLTRASGARRRLLQEQIYPFLFAHLSGPASEAVRKLQEGGATSVGTSSTHIRRWTIEAVLADWNGYRTASTHMRASMRTRVEEEQRVIYPLLRG